ncbi:DUF4259 domain-containing protein [Corynebacterium falsenii]
MRKYNTTAAGEKEKTVSTWDEKIFGDEDNQEFLDELIDLDHREVEGALEDAVNIALLHADQGSSDYRVGLCAATVAAIWAGAPFSSASTADEHEFIRRYIGSLEPKLQELSLQLLDRELERGGTDAAEGLETCVEALS